MKKLIQTLVIIIILVAAGGFAWNWYIKGGGPQLKEPVSDFLVNFSKVTQDVITPPPLRKDSAGENSQLSIDGVIYFTNEMRKGNGGLPALSKNSVLNLAAKAKLDDMFNNQYFEHVSPAGKDVNYWVTQAGYEYIVIGENLALGNFSGDKDLVQAWMDSPGHRANILSPKYSQIGVAVGKGVFEGKNTWLAVQMFGMPITACDQPDPDFKKRIQNYEFNLNDLEQQIISLKAQIENINPGRRGDYNDYNALVSEYNGLVSRYNSSVEEIKQMIELYNSEVKTFNACAEGV